MNDAVVNTKNNALVLDTAGEKLDKEVSLVEQQAASVVVASDEDYANAGTVTAEIKKVQKKVTEYWEPLRASTYKAYQDVMARKKEMLGPLESAEKILKKKMVVYYDEKERKRKEQEEAMRRLAQEEADRKLEEAIAADAVGDTIGAEFAMAEAEIMDDVAVSGGIQSQAPKASGVSTTKTWVIESIDESKVPVDINGAVIRPVDEKAVMALIKATKGKISIPGIKYKETVTVSVRS